MIERLYSLMGPLSRLPHGSRAARRYIRALPATKCWVENNISCLLAWALALNYRTRRVKCGCCYTGLFLALRQLVVWCCAEFAVLCSTACHVTHTVDHLPYIHPAAATYLPACVCVCVCSAVSACTGMLCLLLGSEWREREREIEWDWSSVLSSKGRDCVLCDWKPTLFVPQPFTPCQGDILPWTVVCLQELIVRVILNVIKLTA